MVSYKSRLPRPEGIARQIRLGGAAFRSPHASVFARHPSEAFCETIKRGRYAVMETRPSVPAPEWKQILESLEKPLLYASHNDFANLPKLKGLGPYIHSWLEKAGGLGVPPFDRDLLKNFEAALNGFDGLDLDAKRGRIRDAQG